jgi:hypothetical protein
VERAEFLRKPFTEPLDGLCARLDEQLAVGVAAEVECEEIEPVAQVHDPGLGLVEGQPSRLQPPGQPRLYLARTSTLALQDPIASLNRQIRSCQAWLPAGWYVAGHYWDIESGGLDLEARSQGEAWRPFAGRRDPRDGGLADLLSEAKAPLTRFAAVVCEGIERRRRCSHPFLAFLLRRGYAALQGFGAQGVEGPRRQWS